MAFNPFQIATYTVPQLIEFMQTEGITLRDINQVRNLSAFSTDELMQFIASGACTFQDMKMCGLHFSRQQEIQERMMLLEMDNKAWQQALALNNPDAYRNYVATFPAGVHVAEADRKIVESREDELWQKTRDKRSIEALEIYLENYPDGKYALDAQVEIKKIEKARIELETALLEDMRRRSWFYSPPIMHQLLTGASLPADQVYEDAASRFLQQGLRLDYQTLVNNGIIPSEIKPIDLITPEFDLPQVNNFDSFPLDRTDIYFLGVPRSGKSSVLAGLFYTMNREGDWQLVTNRNAEGKDPSIRYYNGLVKAIAAKKPPMSTSTDTINYINIDVPGGKNKKGVSELNFVEISGECFERLAASLDDDEANNQIVWENLGASRCMKNNNRKVLFFLLDYSVIEGGKDISDMDQNLTLQTALTVLCSDGEGKGHVKNCTMSKVDSVAILLTKADLMGTDDVQERLRIGMEYLQNNFRAFMNKLSDKCQQFGINKANNYRPYIVTFSLGEFYVGNTMRFDPTDSRRLAEIIVDMAPSKTNWNPF